MDGALFDAAWVGAAWTGVCDIADIPPLGARVVATARGDIAVFRTRDNSVFALHDRYPHKQGKLSQGIVHGHNVTCPLHNWVIGLQDGCAQGPDAGCVPRVAAKVEDGRISLALA